MKKLFTFLLFSGIFMLMFSGCMKKVSYPDVPAIGYLAFEKLYDTSQYIKSGVLVISYQDGNGDIGLTAGDTFPPYDSAGPYYYNYVIKYFEKQNGNYVEPTLSFPLSARIPLLTPEDPGSAITGFIADTLPLPYPPLYDTIRFEAFIYDRALHKSNVITTPDIILRRK